MSSTAPASACSACGRSSVRKPISAIGPAAVTRPLSITTRSVASRKTSCDRMADIDDGDFHLIAQPLDIGEDFRLARLVKRSQRLVHQNEPGACRQRPSDGDALPLSAGERRRPAVEQMADAQQVDDPLQIGVAVVRRCKPAAISKILADGQMRKQPRVLEDIADAALVPGDGDPGGGVDQHLAADGDAAARRADQAADHIDDARFA